MSDPRFQPPLCRDLLPCHQYDRYRALSFVGTPRELMAYLATAPISWGDVDWMPSEVYQWQLTASIARHPAGKGLRADG